jgi:phosphoribosylglycinamide formyltransferase 1
MKNIVVLLSGGGSNLQAIMDAVQAGNIDGRISAVISNIAGVKGLERAEKAGIETKVINHKEFESRELFDTALGDCIEQYQPDVIVMAGFMRILTEGFTNRFLGKMLNIHPSLLPKYQGLNTHQRAIDAGDDIAGVTVHFVTAELDGGPAIVQAIVPVSKDDNADSLAKRVLIQEHIIYAKAVQWFCQGQLSMTNNGVILNGEQLSDTGFQIDTCKN